MVFEAVFLNNAGFSEATSAAPPLIPCPVARVIHVFTSSRNSIHFFRKKIQLGSRYTMDHHDGTKKFEI